MMTMKFAERAKNVKSCSKPNDIGPIDIKVVNKLKGEIKYLKEVLNLNKRGGGFTELIYKMKELKEENNRLRGGDLEEVNLLKIENKRLREKLVKMHERISYTNDPESQNPKSYIDINVEEVHSKRPHGKGHESLIGSSKKSVISPSKKSVISPEYSRIQSVGRSFTEGGVSRDQSPPNGRKLDMKSINSSGTYISMLRDVKSHTKKSSLASYKPKYRSPQITNNNYTGYNSSVIETPLGTPKKQAVIRNSVRGPKSGDYLMGSISMKRQNVNPVKPERLELRNSPSNPNLPYVPSPVTKLNRRIVPQEGFDELYDPALKSKRSSILQNKKSQGEKSTEIPSDQNFDFGLPNPIGLDGIEQQQILLESKIRSKFKTDKKNYQPESYFLQENKPIFGQDRPHAPIILDSHSPQLDRYSLQKKTLSKKYLHLREDPSGLGMEYGHNDDINSPQKKILSKKYLHRKEDSCPLNMEYGHSEVGTDKSIKTISILNQQNATLGRGSTKQLQLSIENLNANGRSGILMNPLSCGPTPAYRSGSNTQSTSNVYASGDSRGRIGKYSEKMREILSPKFDFFSKNFKNAAPVPTNLPKINPPQWANPKHTKKLKDFDKQMQMLKDQLGQFDKIKKGIC